MAHSARRLEAFERGHDPAGMSETAFTESQREWRSSVATLVSYRYLGTYSEPRGRHAAEGKLTIRSDLRGPAGLLAGPLGHREN